MKKRKSIVVAMAALTGVTIAQQSEAMEVAMQDMQEAGMEVTLEYTWNPFDGMVA